MRKKRVEKAATVPVSAQELFAFAEEFLDQGKTFKFSVTGNSMYPFLRHITDSVELERVPFEEVRLRDVVMVRRLNGIYVMHRICKMQGEKFYMVGDSQKVIEGPLNADQVVAKVVAIYKREKRIDCKNWLYRFLVRVWSLLLPIRINVLNVLLFLRGSKTRF